MTTRRRHLQTPIKRSSFLIKHLRFRWRRGSKKMGDITPATFASGSWRCDITLTKMCLTKRTVKMEVNLPSRGFLPKTRRVLFSSTVSFILEELESAPVRQEVHGFVALMPSVKNKSFWGWKSGSCEHDYLTLTRHVCFQTAGFSFTLWHVYFSVRREVEGRLEAPSLLLTLNHLTHSTTKTVFFPLHWKWNDA